MLNVKRNTAFEKCSSVMRNNFCFTVCHCIKIIFKIKQKIIFKINIFKFSVIIIYDDDSPFARRII